MPDYKSVQLAAIICAILVNTLTHRQTAFDSLYYTIVYTGWWSGVLVSALASINEANLRRPG